MMTDRGLSGVFLADLAFRDQGRVVHDSGVVFQDQLFVQLRPGLAVDHKSIASGIAEKDVPFPSEVMVLFHKAVLIRIQLPWQFCAACLLLSDASYHNRSGKAICLSERLIVEDFSKNLRITSLHLWKRDIK